jgi:hypothetical protein
MIEPMANARLDLRTTVLRTVSRKPRSSRTFVTAPEHSRFEVLALAFVLTMVLAVTVAWYFELSRPVVCQSSPLIFKFGGEADATMALRSNSRCPAFVHTGSVSLDEPIIAVEPSHGTLTPRGRSGVYYRPEANFTGQDFFMMTLSGRTSTQAGTMTVRVNVSVQ